MTAEQFFTLEREDHVAHLMLNRPDSANSMSPDFWQELPVRVAELESDPSVRALVISGNGKHFTSGMDLSTFDFIYRICEQDSARAAFALRQEILALQNTFNVLENARFPIIAAIHGACVGAGVDMICACDIRIASEDARFSIEEINVGMAADVGTLQRLPKLIAPGIAKELAMTGRRFLAREAKEFGFLNQVHETRDGAIEAAMNLAKEIAQKSPIAMAGVKRSIDYARDHSVSDSLEQIATWNSGMLRPNDLKIALEARMKRKEALFADFLDDLGPARAPLT